MLSMEYVCESGPHINWIMIVLYFGIPQGMTATGCFYIFSSP